MKRVIQALLVLTLAMVAPVTVTAQKSVWEQQKAKAQAGAAKNQPTASTTQQRGPIVVVHDHDRDADGRPPGWDHGRKVGWRGGDLPPGQAKKVSEHRYYRHRRLHHRRYWDREHHRDWDREHHRRVPRNYDRH